MDVMQKSQGPHIIAENQRYKKQTKKSQKVCALLLKKIAQPPKRT